MTPTTFEQAVDACLAEMRAVMIERQKAYGDDNIRALGMIGVLRRAADDKMNRLMRYYKREEVRGECLKAGMPQDEVDRYLPTLDFASDKIVDAHIDAANFLGPIGLMLRRGWWGLPMEDERSSIV